MLKKHLLTIFLLLPLVAISATALAGSTISDRRYWPSDVRQSTQITTVVLQRDLSSAFAYDRSPRLQPCDYRVRPDPHGGVIRVARNPADISSPAVCDCTDVRRTA